MIKYTEDIADKDLERQLLRRVSSAPSHQNGSARVEVEEENVRVTTAEKKKITIRMQNEEEHTTTIEAERTVEVARTAVLLSQSTPNVAGSPEQTITVSRPATQALYPLTHQVLRREPVPRPSIGQFKSNGSSIIKRAALVATRTPQSQVSDDFDDFPQARHPASIPSSSKTPQPKKITARPIGLLASRAPSVRQPAKQKLAALSSNRSASSVPLSQSLAARGKRVRMGDPVVLGETVNDSPPSSPTASTQMVQDHPIFSTPPRPVGGMLSSGSSVRKRNLVDTGSSSGLLVTLLRNARARTIQDWSSMAAVKSGVMVKPNSQMNLQIKAIRVFTSVEHVTVECRVLNRGPEESVAIGDCLTCIIPYYPFDSKDTSTKMTLHNLGHIAIESSLDGAVLTIHRPWKLLTLPDTGARLIVCSGLVTSVPSDLVEMSSSTG